MSMKELIFNFLSVEIVSIVFVVDRSSLVRIRWGHCGMTQCNKDGKIWSRTGGLYNIVPLLALLGNMKV